MSRAYKILGARRRPCHGGTGQWPPPGEWLRVDGPLVACEHGLHLCREQDLVRWLGPEIWLAEYDDDAEVVVAPDKLIVRRARLIERVEAWTETTARLFAADCAEHALPVYERRYAEDARPRRAIAAARAYARGEIDAAALAAARDAAWAVARDAARDAAWDAAWSAAWDAALAAARAAASDAASDAALSAARDAERTWQTARLIAYLRGEVS